MAAESAFDSVAASIGRMPAVESAFDSVAASIKVLSHTLSNVKPTQAHAARRDELVRSLQAVLTHAIDELVVIDAGEGGVEGKITPVPTAATAAQAAEQLPPSLGAQRWRKTKAVIRTQKAFEMDYSTLHTCITAEELGVPTTSFAAKRERIRHAGTAAKGRLVGAFSAIAGLKQAGAGASSRKVNVIDSDGNESKGKYRCKDTQGESSKSSGGGTLRNDADVHGRRGMELLVELDEQLQDAPWWMSHPHAKVLEVWNALMLLLLSVVALGTPFRLGFGAPTPCSLRHADAFLDVFFIVDIALTGFGVGYFEGPERHLVMQVRGPWEGLVYP